MLNYVYKFDKREGINMSNEEYLNTLILCKGIKFESDKETLNSIKHIVNSKMDLQKWLSFFMKWEDFDINKLFRCLNRLIIKEDNYVQELDRLYELSLIYGSIFGFSKCYVKLTWVVQSISKWENYLDYIDSCYRVLSVMNTTDLILDNKKYSIYAAKEQGYKGFYLIGDEDKDRFYSMIVIKDKNVEKIRGYLTKNVKTKLINEALSNNVDMIILDESTQYDWEDKVVL